MKFETISEGAAFIDDDLCFTLTCEKEQSAAAEFAAFTNDDPARTLETFCFDLRGGVIETAALSDTDIYIGSHIETEIFCMLHAVADDNMAVFTTEYDF